MFCVEQKQRFESLKTIIIILLHLLLLNGSAVQAIDLAFNNDMNKDKSVKATHSTHSLQTPKIWNIAYSEAECIERHSELKEIHEFFESKKDVCYLAITGMSGMGKTMLARAYANHYTSNYDIVWWFNKSDDLTNQFLRFINEWNRKQDNALKKININDKSYEAVLAAVKDFLRTGNQNWLFIFDNFKDFDEIRDLIPISHTRKRSHILVTTQNSLSWAKTLKLLNFSRKESINLIQNITSTNDVDSANELASILRDYPILIAQVSYFIKNSKISNLSNFINFVNNNNRDISSFLYSIFDLSFKNLKIRNPDAYKMMLFISLLNHENIPVSLMKAWYEEVFPQRKEDFNDTLNCVLQHSMLNLSPLIALDGNIENQFFNIHEIPHQFLKKILLKENQLWITKMALKALRKQFSNQGKNVLYSNFSNILNHAFSVEEHAEKLNLVNEDSVSLSLELQEYYQLVKRDFRTALHYSEGIRNKFVKGNIDPNLKARYFANLSGIYYWLGMIRESMPCIDKSLAIYRKDPDMHDDYIRVLLYRIGNHYYLGNIEASRQLLKELDEYVAKNGFSCEPNSHFGFYNKALYFLAQAATCKLSGDINNALEKLKLSFVELAHIAEKQKNPDSFMSRYLQYYIYQQELFYLMGKSKDQLQQLQDLRVKALKALNTKNHRLYGGILMYLARSLSLNDKVKSAHECIEESIHILNDWFKKEMVHQEQGLAHTILGDIYTTEKDYTMALQEYLYAMKIYKNAYEHYQTEDISRLFDKIIKTSLKLGDQIIAKQNYFEHQKLFGDKHPRTISMIKEIMGDLGQ